MATLAQAIALAAEAHQGQTDRIGQPFLLHPLRVLLRLRSDDERQVGALHDVVERTDVTLEQLAAHGFAARVIAAVDALSRREGEDYFEFVRRAMANPLARPVKRADLLDNIRTTRREPPGEKRVRRLERYERALRILGALDAPASRERAPDPDAPTAAAPGAVQPGQLPAQLGARLLALMQLAEARAALRAYRRNEDPDALHDFRVALRRLRSLERACRHPLRRALGPAGRRLLRALARATNAARDADVRLATLDRASAGGALPAATAWARARLEEERLRARAAVLDEVPPEFRRLRRRLRRRLTRYRLRPGRLLAGPSLEAVLALVAEELRERLLTVLAGGAPLADDRLHLARITGKRLRYTLEPLAGTPGADAALTALRELQELLGTARDLAAFEGALAALSPPPELVGGLVELQGRAQRARAALRAELETCWVGEAAASGALRPVDVMLARLATHDG